MSDRKLTPETLAVLEKSAEERIQYVQSDKWVAYDFAKVLLLKMERLLNAPARTRVKSMLVVGKPNSGKTTLKKKFLRSHPVGECPEGTRSLFHILHIEAPSKVDPAAFCMKILDALGAPYPSRAPFNMLAKQVDTLLKELSVRMIVVDEFHNFLTGRADMLEALLNLIRGISNVRGITFLAFGTPSALEVVAREPQLSSRFTREVLPRWDGPHNVESLMKLLAALEKTLPLKRPSNLHDNPLREKIAAMSEGILGEIVDLLTEGTIAAIERGEERITPALLNSLGWLTPRGREKFTGGE
jgi:GTPase Era involved in 16S rRNA processing